MSKSDKFLNLIHTHNEYKKSQKTNILRPKDSSLSLNVNVKVNTNNIE